jgi:hypothetical protein
MVVVLLISKDVDKPPKKSITPQRRFSAREKFCEYACTPPSHFPTVRIAFQVVVVVVVVVVVIVIVVVVPAPHAQLTCTHNTSTHPNSPAGTVRHGTPQARTPATQKKPAHSGNTLLLPYPI